MRWQLCKLFKLDGAIERGPYVTIGVSLSALKFALDAAIMMLGFHRAWSPFIYLLPFEGAKLPLSGRNDTTLYLCLFAAALPFFWVGVALTVQRLRAAGLPLWLAALLLIPLLKFCLIAVAAVAPTREVTAEAPESGERPTRVQKRSTPDNPILAGVYGVMASNAGALLMVWIGVKVFEQYGAILFLLVPFCVGLGSVMIYSLPAWRRLPACLGMAAIAGVLGLLSLAAFNIEGAVCMLMALPLALAPCMIGGLVGYFVQDRRWIRLRSLPIALSVLMIVPLLMGTERAVQPPTPLLKVTTSVIIDAPPDRVWDNVVSFPDLPPPTEIVFRSGIAYPVRARIAGAGPGAIRYCEFSTGSFVEPIEVWDRPRLLRFSVTQNPPPMKELTIYGPLDTPHLHGFMMSKQGQFRLFPLPGGRTRLEGTTWYRHQLSPSPYWRLWSDQIIHQIHRRVLTHIKRLTEARTRPALPISF